MESASRRDVLIAGLAALGLVVPAPSEDGSGRQYACPPCGCGRDNDVFDRPGTCSACGMTLVEKGAAAAAPAAGSRVRAAVLIFDGVQVIDFAAPYEVLGQAGYEVFTVAAETRPIVTAMGLRVTPRYALAEAPPAQVVLVPGGDVDASQADRRVLDWIRAQARDATHVISVCNGAFILAATGLLDGLQATTFYDLIEALKKQATKTTVVSDRRLVDNGKFITTAGLSSGIDGALHVVSKISGPGQAQMAALNMEYDWRPEGGYARASLADAPIRRLFGRGLRLQLEAPERAEVVSTRGDRARWEVVWTLTTARTPESVRDGVAAAIESRGAWTRTKAPGSATGPAWTFADGDVTSRGFLSVTGSGASVRVALRVERPAS